jgi:hypothetical protein
MQDTTPKSHKKEDVYQGKIGERRRERNRSYWTEAAKQAQKEISEYCAASDDAPGVPGLKILRQQLALLRELAEDGTRRFNYPERETELERHIAYIQERADIIREEMAAVRVQLEAAGELPPPPKDS